MKRVALVFESTDRAETFEYLIEEGALLVVINADGDVIEFEGVKVEES